MRETSYRNLMIALTAAGPASTLAVGSGGAHMPFSASSAVALLGMAVTGWCLNYWKGEAVGSAHNRRCRELMRNISELPRDERAAYVMRGMAHDKVDGKDDFANALRSLIEQECVRDVEIRDHLDGTSAAYMGPHFGVTGKRYRND